MERMENVQGAFRVKKEEDVRGKKILIIDDVYTTGATLDACAIALKAAGARRVEVLTFASGGDYAGTRGEDDPDEGYDRKERR
jgi:predicted amidophosphoribosyltransferase